MENVTYCEPLIQSIYKFASWLSATKLRFIETQNKQACAAEMAVRYAALSACVIVIR